MDEWITNRLEDWLGLSINREKTSVVHLKQGESLEFLGFTFRYDRDLQGRDHHYLNIVPSKKSLTHIFHRGKQTVPKWRSGSDARAIFSIQTAG